MCLSNKAVCIWTSPFLHCIRKAFTVLYYCLMQLLVVLLQPVFVHCLNLYNTSEIPGNMERHAILCCPAHICTVLNYSTTFLLDVPRAVTGELLCPRCPSIRWLTHSVLGACHFQLAHNVGVLHPGQQRNSRGYWRTYETRSKFLT